MELEVFGVPENDLSRQEEMKLKRFDRRWAGRM